MSLRKILYSFMFVQSTLLFAALIGLEAILIHNGVPINHYNYFLGIIFLILSIDVLIISAKTNVISFIIGSSIEIIIFSLNFMWIIFIDYSDYRSYLILPLLVGFIISVFGLYKSAMVLKTQNLTILQQNKRLTLFTELSELVYFEYEPSKNLILIDLTEGFIQKYHLSYKHIELTMKEFIPYIDSGDIDRILTIYNDKNTQEQAIQIRAKLPEMKDYIHLYMKMSIGENDKMFGVIVDINTLSSLQSSLKLKEQEQHYIFDNTRDYIAKIAPDGLILSMSKAYEDFFTQSIGAIKGRNIFELDKEMEFNGHHWLNQLLSYPPYTSKSIAKVNKTNRWISWNNDGVLNEKGEVQYVITVGHDITELVDLNEKLKLESFNDFLTGLLNRRGLFNAFQKIDTNQEIAVFFIDINDFNTVNDYYGHEIGDEIIHLYGEQLKQFQSDECIVGRLSGDEFVVILFSPKLSPQLDTMIHNLKHMNDTYTINDMKIFSTASIGYVVYPQDSQEIDKLISYADLAMYESKNNQNRQVIHYEPYMGKDLADKMAFANEIKQAIEDHAFQIYFQPIIDTRTNTLHHLEALARWNHPQNGFIPPDEFLEHAKDSGLLIKLDLYLINQSFEKFAKLIKDPLYQNTHLSINVTPQTLLMEQFPSLLKQAMENHHINPKRLGVEISEKTFYFDTELCKKQIHAIHNLGVRIALDDFGSNYSSLTVLESMDFDTIKIDKHFIQKIEDPKNIEIIKMILNIAHFSTKYVIAEGVETSSQKDQLITLGCHLHQGFYYSHPKKLI